MVRQGPQDPAMGQPEERQKPRQAGALGFKSAGGRLLPHPMLAQVDQTGVTMTVERLASPLVAKETVPSTSANSV